MPTLLGACIYQHCWVCMCTFVLAFWDIWLHASYAGSVVTLLHSQDIWWSQKMLCNSCVVLIAVASVSPQMRVALLINITEKNSQICSCFWRNKIFRPLSTFSIWHRFDCHLCIPWSLSLERQISGPASPCAACLLPGWTKLDHDTGAAGAINFDAVDLYD